MRTNFRFPEEVHAESFKEGEEGYRGQRLSETPKAGLAALRLMEQNALFAAAASAMSMATFPVTSFTSTI